MNQERNLVLQIGSAAVTEVPFSERQLRLVPVVLSEISAKTHAACAVLIAEASGRIGLIRSCLEALSEAAQESGLAIAIIVPSPDQLRVVKRVICELGLESRSTVNISKDTGKTAEFLARWSPGPPLGNPTVLPLDLTLQPRTKLLLQKSFYDCDRIFLQPLGGGRDAMGVFCVHAWLKKSVVGPRPLPFFFKVSAPNKIKDERLNYEHYADFYIPFFLRPNVVPARCAQIKDSACLVGNFVEDSVPLRVALRANQSPGIIFSLFEISLRGFRSQPANGPTESLEQPLGTFVRERARSVEIESNTVQLARSFGLTLAPTEIEKRLCTAIGLVTRRFSPYHGDLHSGNIMVRGNDAILIDFSAVKKGPLTADPATLEVSLVFGTDLDDRSNEFEEWRKAVDEIYNGVPIHQPPSPGVGPGPFAWLYRALREIRHVLLGCDCKQEEAAEVLAAYLLRFARLTSDKFENDSLSELARRRQAYALVVAERIVTSLAEDKSLEATQ